MVGYIRGYSRLYVTDHINYLQESEVRIVRSNYKNQIYVEEVETGYPMIASKKEKLSRYVTRFGNPTKKLPEGYSKRQDDVLEKLKYLKKLGRI